MSSRRVDLSIVTARPDGTVLVMLTVDGKTEALTFTRRGAASLIERLARELAG